MTTDTFQPRQPKGIPVGGEFAAIQKADDGLTSLTPATEDVFRKKYESIDEKIEAFKGELEKGIADLVDDEHWNAYLDTMSKFHRYSWQNQMLIYIQNPDATKVAGFRKWQEMGRQVRKGEKGLSILAPRAITAEVDPLTPGAKRGKDGKFYGRKVIGFTTASVFDVSQTDGDELPDYDWTHDQSVPDGFAEGLTSAIEAEGFTVEYKPLEDGHGGYTAPGSKKVVINSNLPASSAATTLAHELGHIKAGHLERMGDYHTGNGGCRGEMELEAESIGYAVSRAAGMSKDIGKVSSPYIAGWTRNKPEAIKDSASRVSKAVKEILSGGKIPLPD